MFSFFNGPVNLKRPTKDIRIDELIEMIINNPHKNSIKALRMMSKDDLLYKPAKRHLPSVCIHGSFSYLSTKGLRQLSGYLYYDIDKGIDDIDTFLAAFKAKHQDILSVCGKSVGGQGIFFYVKLAQPELLTPQNYRAVQKYIGDTFFSDYTLDANAAKLTQPNFISYDENLFVNKSASVTIDVDVFNSYDNRNIEKNDKQIKGKRQYDIDTTTTTQQHITLPFTFLDRNEFWHKIVWETPVDTNGDAYVVKAVDYVKLKLNKIEDNTKHKRFFSMVFVLRKLNPSFDFSTVYSFMYYVNEKYTCDCPMEKQKLLKLVSWAFQKFDADKVRTRVKKIHFAPDCGLTVQQKIRRANLENAIIRQNISIGKIRAAVILIKDLDDKVTATAVARVSGLSRPTVRKYLEAVLNDLGENTDPDARESTQQSNREIKRKNQPMNNSQDRFASPDESFTSIESNEIDFRRKQIDKIKYSIAV